MSVRAILLAAGLIAAFPAGYWYADLVHADDGLRIVDGDTVVIGKTRYRLSGIDAPELGQECAGWPAGKRSAAYLVGLVVGRQIECTGLEHDRYGRTLAVCKADGVDLGRTMVAAGMAWAYVRYSRAYAPEEATARANGVGVHAHPCQYPWDWRAAHR